MKSFLAACLPLVFWRARLAIWSADINFGSPPAWKYLYSDLLSLVHFAFIFSRYSAVRTRPLLRRSPIIHQFTPESGIIRSVIDVRGGI